MISINLLPKEKKEKIKIAKQNLGLLIFCLGIFIIVGIIYFVLLAAQYTVKASLNATKSNIDQAQNALDAYQDVENEISFIKDRLSDMNKSASTNKNWSVYIDEITKSAPSTMIVSGININTKNSPVVKITGLADSRLEAVTYQKLIEDSSYFKDTTFETSIKTTRNDKEYIEFTLSANLEK